MVINGHAWVIYGQLWSCMVMCGHVWSCRTEHDFIWSCTVLYGHVWSSTVMYGHVWSCMVLYGYLPSHPPRIVVNTMLHSGIVIKDSMTSSILIQVIIPNNLKVFKAFRVSVFEVMKFCQAQPQLNFNLN